MGEASSGNGVGGRGIVIHWAKPRIGEDGALMQIGTIGLSIQLHYNETENM